MNYFIFWATLVLLAFIILVLDKKFGMLRDNSTASARPYSFSRVQLAWWSVIILSCIITVILGRQWQIPDLSTSTLYLLGISSATTIGATLIDLSDQNNTGISTLNQNTESENFFLDIMSDKSGVSVHRFQTVIFNLVFGVWFIKNFLMNINNAAVAINDIIPLVTDNNLILLGVSSGMYTAIKATENKQNSTVTQAETPAANTEEQPLG